MSIKIIGNWWNSGDSRIRVVQIGNCGGRAFALNGWNGEVYTDCWEVNPQNPEVESISDISYTLRPVYRYEEDGIDISGIEENSAEWDNAVEAVDYTIE